LTPPRRSGSIRIRTPSAGHSEHRQDRFQSSRPTADSNQNGVYDAGQDELSASAVVAKKSTSFALSASLRPGRRQPVSSWSPETCKLSSAPATAPLITEDSTAPTVTAITRLGEPQTPAARYNFQGRLQRAGHRRRCGRLRLRRSGSLGSGASLSISGSGNLFTVKVDGVTGSGTLGLDLIDDDTIRDSLTNGTQAHALAARGRETGASRRARPTSSRRQTPTAWPRSSCPRSTSLCWACRCRPARSSSTSRPTAGGGKLLGHLLTTASNLIDLQTGQRRAEPGAEHHGRPAHLVRPGDQPRRRVVRRAGAAATTDVLQLHVAPVRLDLPRRGWSIPARSTSASLPTPARA